MSEILKYMCSAVRSYLDDEIDVDRFRESFAGAYFYVRNLSPRDKEASSLVDRVMPSVAEFSGGYRSEQSLRDELGSAIRPFEDSRPDVELVGYSFQTESLSRGNVLLGTASTVIPIMFRSFAA
jgi:hypothetical protein